MLEIENINKGVKEALKPKQQKKMKRSEPVIRQEEKVKCDKCKFSTVVAKDLRLHIIEKHSTNIFQGHELDSQIQQIDHVDSERKQEAECELEEASPKEDINVTELFCEKCDETFSQKNELERHVELHSFADKLSLTFHLCKSCDKPVNTKDLKIQCSKCIFIFHKRCTDRKDARRNWRSSSWTCEKCSFTPIIPAITSNQQEDARDTLNPDADVFLPNDDAGMPSVVQKQPTFTGKHKKSKVNIASPETEFLQTTIDTLKATIAMNEIEIKKLKESNDIKVKRIFSLESQVQEARNHLVSHKCQISENATDQPIDVNDKHQEDKLNSLENRTNSIEETITNLASKIDNLHNLAAKSSDASMITNPRSQEILKTYLCDSCDYETAEKSQLKTHIETHKPVRFQCQKCSYVAIHNRDLNRHDNTMHSSPVFPEVFGCNLCGYSTQHRSNLDEHIKDTHSQQSRYFYSSSRKVHKENLSEKLLHCNKCNFQTKLIRELSRHKAGHIEKSTPRVWTRKFNGRNEENRNLKPMSECGQCEEKFYHEDEADLHMKYFHGPIDENYSCHQ